MQQRPKPTAKPNPAGRPNAAPRKPGTAPRTNRPAAGKSGAGPKSATRPGSTALRRPNPAPRPAAASNGAPRRRPMTRQQYEAIMRQRRQQNIKYMAMLGGLAVVLVVAVVLILMPRKPSKDVSVMANPVAQAANPISQTSVDLSDPRDGDAMDGNAVAAAVTAIPMSTLNPNAPLPVAQTQVQRTGGLRSARMRVIGDVMVCQGQLDAYKATGYDFHPEFDYIKDMLANADYTMANMEGTVGQYNKKAYSGYPLFNCPETILEALKDSGVDFLTLANNHMLDRWFNGVKNTVGWVKQYGFDYVGAYLSPQERKTPVIYEVNGIRIGFVAYTLSTNTQEKVSDADAVEYGVPYLYKSDIEGDIQRLRQAGAEVVIAFPHWGKEYLLDPDDNQTKYAKKLAEAGADIILGSHTHTVQPMMYKTVTDSTGRSRDVFLIFSLGNFLSDHVAKYTDGGIIVDFTISENADGTFSCENVGYIPTYCWQPTEGDARVLPSGKYLNNRPAGMSDAAYSRMVETYSEITSAIGAQFPVLEG